MIALWARPIGMIFSGGLHCILLLVVSIQFASSAALDKIRESDVTSVELIVAEAEETSPMQDETEPDSVDVERAEDDGYIKGKPTPRQAAYSPPPPPKSRAQNDATESPIEDIDHEVLLAALLNPDKDLSDLNDDAVSQNAEINQEPVEPKATPVPVLSPKRRRNTEQPVDIDTDLDDTDPDRVEFDLKNFASLLNQIPDITPAGSDAAVGKERKRPPPFPVDSEVTGFDATLSREEQAAFQAKVSACWEWNMPFASVAGEQELIVTMGFKLDRNGEVLGKVRWVNETDGSLIFKLAAEGAARAILTCAPYDLPDSKYEAWRNVEMNFDPQDMVQ